MTFKLDWRAMEETLIENAAAEMIRFNVARRCGEAFIERIKERLIEDKAGDDGGDSESSPGGVGRVDTSPAPRSIRAITKPRSRRNQIRI